MAIDDPYEREELADPYDLRQRRSESAEHYAQRLREALSSCASKLKEVQLARIKAERTLSLAEFTPVENARHDMAWANFKIGSEAAPFIKQHNAISTMVEDLLLQAPGRSHRLVRFLAATLDMELPEQWRADPS